MNRETNILLWSSNVWYFGAGLLGPLFAVFTQEIGGDIFSITSVWGVYLVSMGLLVMLVGLLSDKSYRTTKFLILLGYFLNAILTFGYIFVSNPGELMVLQLGLGVAAALAVPTWSALYDHHSVKGKKGYAWGLSSGWQHVATGLAIFAGGYIVSAYSFKVLFLIMGIFQLLAFYIQWRMFTK